jgi:ABC-type nitrate/sulfonate/bicarbonate transport system ATPase subunit
MAQRVNLARALIVNPDLLILDEAFTSLDFKVKYSIMQDINQLWQQRKFTIIFVTHDLKEALILADRIILLSGRPSKIKKVINIDSSLNRSIGSLDFLKLESELIELVCND